MANQSSRELFVKRSKERIKQALKSRDMVLASVSRTFEDLDKIINLLGERLEEWYGIYLPELVLTEKLPYSEFVLAFNKGSSDEKLIASIIGPKRANDIIEKGKNSMGAELSEEDIKEVKSLATTILELNKLREQYEKYQEELTKELCPNTTELIGSSLAAKLVTHVGSVQRLALLPASSIQVIGAEKALFKHLKNKRIDPPKHGLIFQYPKISSSPKNVRGKIARLLANKISLAIKADAFTKNNISDKIKKDFEERLASIMGGK